jgi:cytochrome P450
VLERWLSLHLKIGHGAHAVPGMQHALHEMM